MASLSNAKNPFAKVLGPPNSDKSGFKGGGIVNSSTQYESGPVGHNKGQPPVGKGNMPAGGSMQAQMDAVKRRLAADVANDKKTTKSTPVDTMKKNAIIGVQGSTPVNVDHNQGSANTMGTNGSVHGGTNRGTKAKGGPLGNVTPNQRSNGIG